MKRSLFIPACALGLALLSSCWSNQDGAGGTTDYSNEQAYDMNFGKHLASPMDSVATTTAPAQAPADTAKAAPADSAAAPASNAH